MNAVAFFFLFGFVFFNGFLSDGSCRTARTEQTDKSNPRESLVRARQDKWSTPD